MNPQLVIEEPQGKYQSLDRIMASVRATHPNRYGSWTLEMPRSPQGMITAWYDKPTEMQLAFVFHRLLGLFSAVALLVLAFTGFLLSYPSVLETLTGSFGMKQGETGRNITSTAVANNHPTDLAAASFVAQGPFPRAELRRVTPPACDTGIYGINLRQSSEINKRHPYTTVWVDRWSGQIIDVRNPAKFSKGETFASWIWRQCIPARF